jgi:hypothetical protein
MLLLILIAYVKAKKHFLCINLLVGKKIKISFFYTTLTYFIITALLQDNDNLFSINGHTMEVAHYSLLSIKRRELIFLIMTKWCILIIISIVYSYSDHHDADDDNLSLLLVTDDPSFHGSFCFLF